METVDTVVVGAGVVGLAITRALARAGHDVLLLESEDAIGTGTSSRNSEVIHAGIYYPAGSHKARLCVAGKHELYRFAAEHGVAHRRCGKLIVATSAEQEAALHVIRDRAARNGVDDLRWLDGDEARRLEPELACTAALESPSTGIIDSHGFMRALLVDAKLHGAVLALRSTVERCRVHGSGIDVHIGGTTVRARRFVNSAGLFAPQLASRMDGFPQSRVPQPRYCKGSYFSLAGPSPFSRLVYPVPEAAGLGVHLTLDLGGQARFGPDVQWVESIDYDVDESRCAGFYQAIRRYWPNLKDGSLRPGYAGIRPKAHAPHEPAADFIVDGPAEHGVPGLVQLFGIESPGLTASLALAELVRAMIAT